jgi:chromosome condensin MukBEF ATPase and DNA-binding subunit MukB
MINKKEKEVKELNRKNKELKQYNQVCKKRQEALDNFAEFLKDVLAQDTISDISLRARSGQENRRRNDRCCVQWH